MKIDCWENFSEKTKEESLIQVRNIFFESSSIDTFEDETHKEQFYQKWLGKYINKFPDYFLIAHENKIVLGYLVGCPDSLSHPELQQPVVGERDDYKSYPFHLHMNCHKDYRGKGVGGKLLLKTEQLCRERGCSGLHLITKEGVLNQSFYEKYGHKLIRKKEINGNILVMLGKSFQNA